MSKSISHFLNAYLPPAMWALLIYVLSAQSVLPTADVFLYDFIFKKCSHMFVYAVLYFLLDRGVNLDRRPKDRNWILPLFLCLTYACLDEFHQYFTPHRYPTIRDVGFDSVGMMVAFLRLYRYI